MNIIYTTYKDMWLKTMKFKSRSNNEEFWWPFFINLLISLFCFYGLRLPVLMIAYNAIIALPFISLSIRRMHDINKSGWNILWFYIPSILLIIYAGAILYYTQTPDIIDMFLQWFTVMVVGYVVFVVYSVYLFMHRTYPQKNRYGDISNTKSNEVEDSIIETVGKNVEDTLSFKTKAFLKKVGSKKKEEKSASIESLEDIVQPILVQEEPKLEEEELPSINESSFTQHISPMGPQASIDEEEVTPVAEVKEEPPVVVKPIDKDTSAMDTHEEVIVRAQLKAKKPKQKDIVVVEDATVKITLEQETDTKGKEPVVKTVAQKRTEVQHTIPDKPISEVLKEEKMVKAEKKVVHRPVKRKVIQPIEAPDMNVETIRTHSLDSIAKLMEKNMTKNSKEGPMVVATVKKRPAKQKKKED